MTNASCKECGENEYQYDERLGEQVCSSCGLVLILNPFEETTRIISLDDDDQRPANLGKNGQLGSYIIKQEARRMNKPAFHREHMRAKPETETDKSMKVLLTMYLSYYNVGWDIKTIAWNYYKAMEHLYRGYSVEKRAAGITFYVLKEQGIVCHISAHSKLTKVSKNDISKLARKAASFQKKSNVFAVTNHLNHLDALLGRLERKIPHGVRHNIIRVVEYTSREIERYDLRYSDNMLVGSVWMASEMMGYDIRQEELTSVWSASAPGLRASVKQICDLFKINRKKLSDIDIDEFVLGVRC